MQESLLGDPTLLLDDDAMHDRNLSGGAAEAQGRDAQPYAQRLPQRGKVAC
jgi:hypothetical protein